jgi:hypothetical protein
MPMETTETEKNVVSKKIEGEVEITEYDDGSMSFRILGKPSLWTKIKNFFSSHKITPYAKLRDLSDPINRRIDSEVGQGGGKRAYEIGIKISF